MNVPSHVSCTSLPLTVVVRVELIGEPVDKFLPSPPTVEMKGVLDDFIPA